MQIEDTAQEKVLIKRQVLHTSKYEKDIIQYAKKKVSEHYQQSQEEKEHLYQVAYQHGYNNGVKQLLNDFIAALEKSEKAFQKQVNKSQEKLEQLLIELFSDERLKEIIACYFINQHKELDNITLHLPIDIQHYLENWTSEIHIVTHTINESIALEVDNEIHYFSPLISAKNTLPHIFSVPTRCQILNEQKVAYQKLIEKIQREGNNDDDIHE